jgi:hypothetical protein
VFLKEHRSATPTRLQSNQVACFFDPKLANAMGRGNELIDPTHPIIQWIRSRYESGKDHLYPLSAIRLEASHAQLPPGLYTFVAQRWAFNGIKLENRIAYRLARYSDRDIFSGAVSERTVMQAVQRGQPQVNVGNMIDDLERVTECLTACEKALDTEFWRDANNFEIENGNRCDVQLQSAATFSARKSQELEERIERVRATADPSKLRIIPALEGQLKKLRADLEVQRQLIDQKRNTSFQPYKLAEGVIFLV